VAAPLRPTALGQHQKEVLGEFARLFERKLCAAFRDIDHAAFARPRRIRRNNRGAIADGAANGSAAVG
jgi:hypothetical protein